MDTPRELRGEHVTLHVARASEIETAARLPRAPALPQGWLGAAVERCTPRTLGEAWALCEQAPATAQTGTSSDTIAPLGRTIGGTGLGRA